MKIEELPKGFDYHILRDLILAEWPVEFGEKTDEEKIEEIAKSADITTDINKVLIIEDKIIGWYRYSKWPRDQKENKSAHTLDIAVLPEYQGKGYGKALMENLIQDCRIQSYENLKSRTFDSNIPSIKLHKSTGFKEVFRTGNSIVWEIELKKIIRNK